MSASRLCVDLDVYRGFVAELAELADDTDPGTLLTRYSAHSDYCLPPTMCFHTYHQMSGRTLAADAQVVTARGKSFRFESRYQRSLERLWDFTIREIVFIGDGPTVARHRERFLAAACELAERLGLAGRVESAEDPFFADPTVPRRMLAQRLGRLKYELRLPVEDGRTISVASFNVHGTTFGEPYDIRLPSGEVAQTACVGFGLERFAFALFCQHGLDPEQWPASCRDVLSIPTQSNRTDG
jgi:seryl-tRNA synthetase